MILTFIAAGVGAATGLLLAIAMLRLARALATRTHWWLPIVAGASGLGAGTLTSLNVIDQQAAPTVVFGMLGYAAGFVVAWFALAHAADDAGRRSVGGSSIAIVGGTVAVVFCSGIALLHSVIGDRAMALSPAAIVAYAVLLAVPLIGLLLIVGSVVGLIGVRRGPTQCSVPEG